MTALPRAVPRLVIAGTASNVGKTTFTSALARVFTQRGLRVAVFKCGPDYLDPSYLALAANTVCHNLDGWMMGQRAVVDTFESATANADVAVIEGVMGLFDGADPQSDAGSTAEIAKWLDSAVVLVADCSGMARSAGALVRGFRDFDPELKLAGVVCNRVGSKSHLSSLTAAIAPTVVYGGLPKRAELSFPSRHLGLHRAAATSGEVIEQWANAVTEWCDIDGLLRSAGASSADAVSAQVSEPASMDSRRCRIGVADDAAFQFYYEHNLRSLERAGAELVRFSPMTDPTLPDVDGVYLGGGYPELYASELSGNSKMLHALRRASVSGMPIYAECGGLMYLCSNIRTDAGTFPMVGIFEADAVLRQQRMALGYATVSTSRPTLLGPIGTSFRGHQFRYSELEWPSEVAVTGYRMTVRRTGQMSSEGFLRGNTLGSYVHAHWGSNPDVPRAFVEHCAVYRERFR